MRKKRFKSKSLINSNKYRHKNETKKKAEEKNVGEKRRNFSNFNFHQFHFIHDNSSCISLNHLGTVKRWKILQSVIQEQYNQVFD